MLGAAMYTTIKTLMERGLNKSQIAKATGHAWKTVSKVVGIIQSGKVYPEKKPHPRILDSYREELIKLMEEGLSGVRIHQELRSAGVSVGYTAVKDYIREIRKRDNIFVRIHTSPGEEAQVDFGYVGMTPDKAGKKRRTWVFNMRLSYSRLDYYEKVYNQRVETFIQCHINAFDYFGGVPECVKIDNLKAAILEANFYEPVYQELYKNFADHYGFKIIPCRIYRPNDKGKVESGIKYVKNNFFIGRRFEDGKDTDRQLKNWQENVCNSRIHGTTRKVPREVFDNEERARLKTLPPDIFKMADVGTRKVYHDCHIYVDYSYYSVPFEYVGKVVEIELSHNLLKVYYRGKEIAIHTRKRDRGSFSTNESHYPKYKRYSDTEYQERYQIKMSEIGEYAEQLFLLIIEKRPKDWTRIVQGILSLLKRYPKDILNLACRRALAFGIWQHQIINNICSNGSYNMPIEFNSFEETKNYEYAQI
jgi:transposase